ncbi:uncharacterized protein PV09_07370 [Verruconis gallopava]|uniref:Zn(2)-C6 fungal-type domain-containing protein n=1 Tax=Verruconis gallopava TaxID=253628 RepID=A0A0D2A3S2_9PEZI|nr:uncharacterized protein PV09_07370 [Verruconis gallopava]KIW01080.1 hypothetical protein PV09_07370 [Verruconis gallopava]
MATANPRLQRDLASQDGQLSSQQDPLSLHEYIMSDSRTPRIESLIHPSPSSSMASGSSPRYPDFAQVSTTNFSGPLPPHQRSPPNPSSSAFLPLNSPSQPSPVILPPLDTHNMLSLSTNGSDTRAKASNMKAGAPRTTSMEILAEASEMASSADKHAQTKRKMAEKDKNEPPPAWSELKTKAGKDRKRLPLACIACRRKKIRCSGEKPACKHCLRSRIPCVYKVTTRKAAPRTDYMAMLDKRLKRMEDRVIKLIPKESQSAVPRAVVRPALPTPPTKTTGKKRAADEAFGDDPDLDKWSRSKIAAKTSELAENFKGAETEEKTLLYEGAEYLPSKEIQEHLAEVYFDFVYAQSYPLLHKPSFMARLSAGNVAPVLVLAVCAISARFSNHPQLRTEPAFLRGEEWAKAARDIALRRWDTPNLTILIVYLLLGLHEFGTCHGGRSWMLAGMAQRMAFALLLHQDLDHNGWGKHAQKKDESEISPTDREIRRRAMWACFLMDRFNASGTDRPMQMSEDFVNIPLPVKERLFEMELSAPTETLQGKVLNPVDKDAGQLECARNNMGTSAYYIKLVAVWGRLVQYWNMGGREKDQYPIWSEKSKLHELRKQVDDFKQQLPAHLAWTPENLQNHESEKTANQFVFLHLVYHQVRLFMNRWALPSSGFGRLDKNIPKTFVIDCARAAIDAANNVSVLIKEAFDHNVTAPFAGYCAFYSSTVHVQGVFSKNPRTQETAKQNLAHNVKYLTKMKKYWGMFHFMTENLKDLYRHHADAVLRGSPESQGKSEAILQYGDWFDHYPSGVSETDYEDPARMNKVETGPDTVLGQKSDLQSVEEFFATLSPATKASQLRKQARRSKAKKAAEENIQAQGITGGKSMPLESQQTLFMETGRQSLPRGSEATGFGIHGTGLEGAQNYNLLNNHNPLIQPPILSQLDRHLVLSSYAGMDPTSAASISNTINEQQIQDQDVQTPMLPDTSNYDMWNTEGLSGFGGLGADASTAWFMPFNLDPPHLSTEDPFTSSVILGNFDFGGQELIRGYTP